MSDIAISGCNVTRIMVTLFVDEYAEVVWVLAVVLVCSISARPM